MTWNKAAAAAPRTDRIETIDALRGFALFGMLLVNLSYWAGLPFVRSGQPTQIFRNIDAGAFTAFFNGVLDGKFYTLFALLFGLGFALQLDQLEQRGTDGPHIFRRRMAGLLLIGGLHTLLLWDGDILMLYAVLGFALPLFRKASDRTLCGWALLFLFAVPLLGVLLEQCAGLHPGAPLFALGRAIDSVFGVGPDTDLVEFARTGGWGHFMAWQSTRWAFNFAERLDNWRIAKVLGMMLLGMLAGRRLRAGTLLADRGLLWRLLIGGLVIGLPTTVLYAQMPPHSQAAWPSLIGTAPLGVAYAAAFLLTWPQARSALRVMAPVGRMALTNYLIHSLLGALIFYGIGLGMMGRLPIEQVYALGLAIYAGQILFARVWLARYRHGPVEAVWRRMTYGKPRTVPT